MPTTVAASHSILWSTNAKPDPLLRLALENMALALMWTRCFPFLPYLQAFDYPAFVQDAAGRWLAVNDTFCRLMLKPRHKLLGAVPTVSVDEPLPNWAD